MGSKIFGKISIIFAVVLVIFAAAKIYSSYISTENTRIIEVSEQDMDIIIYSKVGCIFCIKTKKLLEENQLRYKQIELSNNKALHLKLAKQTGQTTVPYIFINNEFIGGFQDLQNLIKKGKL